MYKKKTKTNERDNVKETWLKSQRVISRLEFVGFDIPSLSGTNSRTRSHSEAEVI